MTKDSPTYREVSLLVVEDDDVDAMAIERALTKLRVANPVQRAHDGVEALEMLRDGRVREPFIIILDLNLPRMSGHEFLEQLRADPELRESIVFVLTTSRDEQDRHSAYLHNVAGYIVKRGFASDFIEVVTMLNFYWRVVTLPDEDIEWTPE